MIELPPGRVPARFFEAARQQADLPPDVAALLDQWYVLEDAAQEPYYQMRGQGILSDEASAALVRFWKDCRLPTTHLAYPGTTLTRADVRARLVLVSIMEGSLARARDELEAFGQLHPGAHGRLAGREVDYAETLGAMLAAAEHWPARQPDDDWPTFAGNDARNKIARANWTSARKLGARFRWASRCRRIRPTRGPSASAASARTRSG